VSQGRPAEAEKHFDEALTTFREAGAKFEAASTLNDIGMMLFNRGDLAGAQKRYEESMALFGEIGEKSGTATTQTNIAEILECRGDLDGARSMHEDALALNRSIGDRSGIAYDLFRLGAVFTLRGDLAAARSRYQEALSIQEELEDSISAADTRVALAGLSIEGGKATEAEKAAREAEEILRTGGALDRGYLALATVSEALLAQGKRQQALAVAESAWKHASESEDRRIRFAVAVARGRAIAASGSSTDVDASLKFLDGIRADAARDKFVVYELEARLAAGEIELAAGRASGKKRLAQLEADATGRGFGRIARRAAAGAA
jgi:tetratricopeptide (TPR) repeat protein